MNSKFDAILQRVVSVPNFLISNGGPPFILAYFAVVLLEPFALLFGHLQVESGHSDVELAIQRHSASLQISLQPLHARYLFQERDGTVRSVGRHDMWRRLWRRLWRF